MPLAGRCQGVATPSSTSPMFLPKSGSRRTRRRSIRNSRFRNRVRNTVSVRLFLVSSVHHFKPVCQKELLFRWQECFRRSNDRPQRRRHLKTNDNENDAPYFLMHSAPTTEKAAHRVD